MIENLPPIVIVFILAQTLLILVGSYRLGVAVRRIRIQRKQLDTYEQEIRTLQNELSGIEITDTMRGHFQM